MLPANMVWRPSTGIGYEHLKVKEEKHQILVDSIVIGSLADHRIFRLQYEITLDKTWVTREVKLRYLGEKQGLFLASDGNGSWQDEQGREMTELSGCVDIDISCTPFTNTLPIKRLSHELLPPIWATSRFSRNTPYWRRDRLHPCSAIKVGISWKASWLTQTGL